MHTRRQAHTHMIVSSRNCLTLWCSMHFFLTWLQSAHTPTLWNCRFSWVSMTAVVFYLSSVQSVLWLSLWYWSKHFFLNSHFLFFFFLPNQTKRRFISSTALPFTNQALGYITGHCNTSANQMGGCWLPLSQRAITGGHSCKALKKKKKNSLTKAL